MVFNLTEQTIKQLTKNEIKLIEYICNHSQQVAFMSIYELSQATHISQSTISRLPRHLGFDNFKQMKQYIIQNNLSPTDKISATVTQSQSVLEFLHLQKQYLEQSIQHIDLDDFQHIVEHIIKAQTIYLFAKGASAALAQLLAFRLRRFKKKVIIMPSSGSEIFETLPLITSQDYMMIFAFQKTPIEAQITIEYCYEHRCPVMMMSSRHLKEKKINHHLYVYRGSEDEYHSSAIAMAYIDALVIEVAKAGGDQYIQYLEDMFQLKENHKTKIQR